jgi:hypothetical protein
MQTAWTRALSSIYISFFLLLAASVLIEAATTRLWLTPYAGTTLTGIAALSGDWFSNLLALINFVFGIGGGLFSKPVARENRYSRKWRVALLWLELSLIIVSLVALAIVAFWSQTIVDRVEDMTQEKVAIAIKVLGSLNVSMAAGFLVGLSIPGVPGGAAPDPLDGELS